MVTDKKERKSSAPIWMRFLPATAVVTVGPLATTTTVDRDSLTTRYTFFAKNHFKFEHQVP